MKKKEPHQEIVELRRQIRSLDVSILQLIFERCAW